MFHTKNTRIFDFPHFGNSQRTGIANNKYFALVDVFKFEGRTARIRETTHRQNYTNSISMGARNLALLETTRLRYRNYTCTFILRRYNDARWNRPGALRRSQFQGRSIFGNLKNIENRTIPDFIEGSREKHLDFSSDYRERHRRVCL